MGTPDHNQPAWGPTSRNSQPQHNSWGSPAPVPGSGWVTPAPLLQAPPISMPVSNLMTSYQMTSQPPPVIPTPVIPPTVIPTVSLPMMPVPTPTSLPSTSPTTVMSVITSKNENDITEEVQPPLQQLLILL